MGIAQDGIGVEHHTLTGIVLKEDTQMDMVVHLGDTSEDPDVNYQETDNVVQKKVILFAQEDHIALDGIGVEKLTLTSTDNKRDTQMDMVVQLRELSEDPDVNYQKNRQCGPKKGHTVCPRGSY